MPYAEHIAWPPGATDGCLLGINTGTRLRMQHHHIHWPTLIASQAYKDVYWMHSPHLFGQ